MEGITQKYSIWENAVYNVQESETFIDKKVQQTCKFLTRSLIGNFLKYKYFKYLTTLTLLENDRYIF